MSLRGVFDHINFVLRSNFENGIHVRTVAIEMNGQDGTRPFRNCRFNLIGTQRISLRVYIDKYRCSTRRGDRKCGRRESV